MEIETKDVWIAAISALLGALATAMVSLLFLAESRLTNANIKEAVTKAREDNAKALFDYIGQAAVDSQAVKETLESVSEDAKYIETQAGTAKAIVENLSKNTDVKTEDVPSWQVHPLNCAIVRLKEQQGLLR